MEFRVEIQKHVMHRWFIGFQLHRLFDYPKNYCGRGPDWNRDGLHCNIFCAISSMQIRVGCTEVSVMNCVSSVQLVGQERRSAQYWICLFMKTRLLQWHNIVQVLPFFDHAKSNLKVEIWEPYPLKRKTIANHMLFSV